MMIGPAPMISMLLMSVRLGIFLLPHHRLAHEPYEAIEQLGYGGRPRRRLRMTLKTERGFVGARKTRQRTVEQRNVRDAAIGRQRSRGDRESVILRRDQYLLAIQVLHRMIGDVMAEFHFHRLAARGQRHQLMAEANAEGRYTALDQFARSGDGIIARFGIARSVGKKDSVRIQSK